MDTRRWDNSSLNGENFGGHHCEKGPTTSWSSENKRKMGLNLKFFGTCKGAMLSKSWNVLQNTTQDENNVVWLITNARASFDNLKFATSRLLILKEIIGSLNTWVWDSKTYNLSEAWLKSESNDSIEWCVTTKESWVTKLNILEINLSGMLQPFPHWSPMLIIFDPLCSSYLILLQWA